MVTHFYTDFISFRQTLKNDIVGLFGVFVNSFTFYLCDFEQIYTNEYVELLNSFTLAYFYITVPSIIVISDEADSTYKVSIT